jgi:hypothetical protein
MTLRIDNLEKNYLINGGIDFAQRSPTSSKNLTTSLTYLTADRAKLAYAGSVTGTPTTQVMSTVPSNSKLFKSLRLSANPNNASVELIYQQRIESVFAVELIGEVVSMRIDHYSESSVSLEFDLSYANSPDNFTLITSFYNSTKTIEKGSFEESKFENISVPYAAKNGIAVTIKFKNMSLTGSVYDHILTGLMLTVGNIARPFKRFGGVYQSDLFGCYRYLETITTDIFGHVVVSATGYLIWWFKNSKRAVPIITFTGYQGTLLDNADTCRALFKQTTVGNYIGINPPPAYADSEL